MMNVTSQHLSVDTLTSALQQVDVYQQELIIQLLHLAQQPVNQKRGSV